MDESSNFENLGFKSLSIDRVEVNKEKYCFD